MAIGQSQSTKIETKVPIYRAKDVDTGEIVYGYYFNFFSDNQGRYIPSLLAGHVDTLMDADFGENVWEIDPNTLEIDEYEDVKLKDEDEEE